MLLSYQWSRLRKNCWKYIPYFLCLLCFLEICVPKNVVQAFCPKWHHTGHECLSLWERTPCFALLQTFCDWVLLESELIKRCMKINKTLSNVKRFLFFCCVCNSSQNDSALPFAEPVLNLRALCSNSYRTRRSRLATFKHMGQLFSQRRGSVPLKVSVLQTPVVPRCNHNSPSFSGCVRTDKRQSHKYTVAPSSSPLWWPVADISMCRYRSGSSQKWIQTGWHLVLVCVCGLFFVFLSNVHVLQGWLATALQTNCLMWLTLSFVRSVPACGPCHCGLAHGL